MAARLPTVPWPLGWRYVLSWQGQVVIIFSASDAIEGYEFSQGPHI